MIKLVSWNLLRLTGASVDDVARLIGRERPDVLLLQEATVDMDGLVDRAGGQFHRISLPGRIHGLGAWTAAPLARPPAILALQPGAMFDRICQVIDLGPMAVANVHLSHGQVLNRRQLRRIAAALPYHAAIVGDFNLVGPALLPGFHDSGPKEPTHRAADLVPLRIDRCLTRGLLCLDARALQREASDHRPITVRLGPVAADRSLRRAG